MVRSSSHEGFRCMIVRAAAGEMALHQEAGMGTGSCISRHLVTMICATMAVLLLRQASQVGVMDAARGGRCIAVEMRPQLGKKTWER